MMQLHTFVDERIKILYALSFMHGGIVHVWAKNEINMILSQSSTFPPLQNYWQESRGLLESQIEKGCHAPNYMP